MPIRLPKTKARLRREAATWLAHLEGRDGRANPAFRSWFEADERNAEAFERVRANYRKAGLLRESALVRRSDRSAHKEPSGRPRFALAAVLAAILLIPAGLLVLKGMGAPPFERREALFLATQIGEMKTVRLEDGSMVVLGGQSAIRVVLDGAKRRADVERGRIRFDIEEGSAPFAIAVGAMEISASGAIIDIELRGKRVRGQVHQGRALVSGRADGTSGPRQIELDAGAAFEGTISGNVRKVRAPQSDEESAAGMLEFEAAPLAEAVEAANRYSRAQILVADDAVGGLKITGAFRVGDAAGLANSLADMFALKVERTSEGNYSLVSPSARKKKGG